jgi:hypothetical protein
MIQRRPALPSRSLRNNSKYAPRITTGVKMSGSTWPTVGWDTPRAAVADTFQRKSLPDTVTSCTDSMTIPEPGVSLTNTLPLTTRLLANAPE